MNVVHVIGLVGAGKTHFINAYFPKISDIFDVKMVYEQHNFSPELLHNNPQLFYSFKNTLRQYLGQFMEQYADLGFFIAESSGANSAFNEIFRDLKEYRIWIDPDYDRIDQIISSQRGSYAKGLNQYLREKYERGEIFFDNSYNPLTRTFKRALPDFLQIYFKKNKIHIKLF
jgi:hypothetical protein